MIQIRHFVDEDFPQVAAIYQQGIDTGMATLETQVKTFQQWDASLHTHSRLVAVDEAGNISGWAGLSPVSARPVYAGVAEVTIYISASSRGKGVGKTLLSALVESSEKHQIWTLKAVIFPENTTSIALHQKCGFREVGIQERIGKLHDKWKDSLIMERRSRTVGID